MDDHTDDIVGRLAAPFPPETISWRVGATTKDKSRGLALAYIDARDVQDRLDQVCGIYWQVRHHHCGTDRLACDIGIKVGDEWLWRGDGAGSTDVEAEKGAFSDSFKRAAVRWGVGRYLYDLDSPWVELEAKGNTHVIKAGESTKLTRMLEGRLKIDTKAPAEPADEAIVSEAQDAARKGSFALRAFWDGLTAGHKRQLKEFLDTTLKPMAARADNLNDTESGGTPSPEPPRALPAKLLTPQASEGAPINMRDFVDYLGT